MVWWSVTFMLSREMIWRHGDNKATYGDAVEYAGHLFRLHVGNTAWIQVRIHETPKK